MQGLRPVTAASGADRVLGRDVRPGHRIDGYCLGGTFTVETIDPQPHRTSGDEWARAAYDHAGRGMVVFDNDVYPLATDDLALFEVAA